VSEQMSDPEKREVYTAIALHALLGNVNLTQGLLTAKEMGTYAVKVADATLKALKEPPYA
jgi:hypothetical protein